MWRRASTGGGGGRGMLAMLTLAVCSVSVPAQKLTPLERKTAVLPELKDSVALPLLDLEFCGSGSEGQISRGPLSCGFPIVGDHPWLVALGFSSGTGLDFHCAGTLLNDEFVLTSARCALGSKSHRLTTVRAGEYDFSSARDCLWYDPDLCIKFVERDVSSVLVHPEFHDSRWGSDANFFDIAVVQLSKPLTLKYGLLPICLPIYAHRLPPKKMFSLSMGLHLGPLPALKAGVACCNCSRDRSTATHVMDSEKLEDHGITYNGSEPCHYRLLTDAGGHDRCVGAGAACVADLGAPLVSPDRFGSTYFVLGVTSVMPSADICRRRPGASVVYTPVRPHVEWILRAIGCIGTGRCTGL